MSENFEDTYFDVLRAIEMAIYETYQQHPDLEDFRVEKVLNGLARRYEAEKRNKRAPKLRFNSQENVLLQQVRRVCELHLGRDPDVQIGNEAITIDEIVACLKRIRRSVDQMGGRGRQAYLEFLHEFFTD
jgi:hypothetical protein